MSLFKKYGEVDKLEKGFTSFTMDTHIHGGILLDTIETAEYGTLLQTTSEQGVYQPVTTGFTFDKFIGVLAGDYGKMNLTYGFNGTTVTKGGDGINVLTQGRIAVEAVSGLTIAENEKVYVVVASGKVTNVATDNILLENARFTGIVQGDIAEVELR